MSHTLRVELSTDHNPAAVPKDGQYWIEFIRKQLIADEVYPSNQRYELAEDKVQYTPDGGATWEDAPGLDPRKKTGLPARTGTALNCNSALSVTEYVRRYINLLVSLLNAGATIAQGTAAVVSYFQLLEGGWAILWAAISGAFGTAATFGAGAINLAFTPAVYDQLTCLLVCRMDDHGQILSDAGMDGLIADIQAHYGAGTVSTLLSGIFSLMGFAGVNHAALFYSGLGDCSGCASCAWDVCLDLNWLWPYTSQALPPAGGAGCPQTLTRSPQGKLGTYSGHPVWEWEKTISDHALRFGRRFSLAIPIGTVVSSVWLSFVRTAGNTDNFTKIWWTLSQAQGCYSGAFHNSPVSYTPGFTGGNVEDIYVGIGSNVANDGGQGFITQIRLIGTGPKLAVPTVPQWFA